MSRYYKDRGLSKRQPQKCPSCPDNSHVIYDTKYDTYFCNKHIEWLEKKCSEADCSYCTTRPEKPAEQEDVNNVLDWP